MLMLRCMSLMKNMEKYSPPPVIGMKHDISWEEYLFIYLMLDNENLRPGTNDHGLDSRASILITRIFLDEIKATNPVRKPIDS